MDCERCANRDPSGIDSERLQRALFHWIYEAAPLRVIDAWRDHKWLHAEPYAGVAENMAATIVEEITSEGYDHA